MSLIGRPSSADDRESITALMRKNLDLPQGSPATNPSLQDWKYWQPHPFFNGSRGYVVHDDARLVSHGCRWPIRLQTEIGMLDGFHLIDWVAEHSANGAGMKLLHECAQDQAGVFSIGGTDTGQRVVAAFGFKPANRVWKLARPLRTGSSPGDESAIDWKSPARFVRNCFWSAYPPAKPDKDWQCNRIGFREIPESLYPTGVGDRAVSVRNARLLEHIAACPQFSSVNPYLLTKVSRPVAYFVLAQTGHEARLLDFGPAALDEHSAQILGTYAQLSARNDLSDATALSTITTEGPVRDGFLRSGLRMQREKMIRVLRLNPTLRNIQSFRLTMMDWDAACA